MALIKAVIFDLGRVLLFPRDEAYFGSLNDLHKVLSESSNYSFSNNFEVNKELLDLVRKKKIEKGISVYLFSKGSIKNVPECKEIFKGIFDGSHLTESQKSKKNDPNTYVHIAENIVFDPSEILYVDDLRENTLAAEKAGFCTITFRNNIQFETEFEGYI